MWQDTFAWEGCVQIIVAVKSVIYYHPECIAKWKEFKFKRYQGVEITAHGRNNNNNNNFVHKILSKLFWAKKKEKKSERKKEKTNYYTF